jgi:hypothetical protein
MFVPPVARQKSRANAPKRSADVGRRGLSLAEHGDSAPKNADAGARDVGQGWSFGKIPLFSSGPGDSVPVQAKLKVGAVHDPLEHEADRVADQALRIPDAGVSSGGAQSQTASMRPRLRAEAAAKPLERDLAGPSSGVAPDSFQGRGSPLPAPVRGLFEKQFQYSFGDVRVHDGPDAAESARGLGAHAYTYGRDIVFGANEYLPGKAKGARLLGHELAHVVQQGAGRSLVQRSPLSDQVKKDWDADPKIETLLARLGQADVQNASQDADLDAMIAKELASKPDDLWLAQRIRRRELGRTSGEFGPKVKEKYKETVKVKVKGKVKEVVKEKTRERAVQRPIEAFFFRGKTDRRALVIAGVHGSERQGMEIARDLIADLTKGPPAEMSAIIVPSLFPDNAESRHRESGPDDTGTPTNRNFPNPDQDLAAATKGGGGKAMDAETDDKGNPAPREILQENQLLMQLMEKFHPERIISLHGTKHTGASGAFYDPRKLRPDEDKAARDWAHANAPTQMTADQQKAPDAQDQLKKLEESLYQQELAKRTGQAADTDRDLSLKTAKQIDAATTGLKGRENRKMDREDEPKKTRDKEITGRLAHPSIAGNVGSTGALDNAHWSGGTPHGVSLGGYAPERGISVFTVEAAKNLNSSDYPEKADDDVSRADRKIELQAYSDAVKTVLLGT